ncbi:hypothetical protein LCGC14_1875100, partial [marine sediment metagenome]
MTKDREERPIIFNSEMVKAILDGRKTQTRRIVETRNITCTDTKKRKFKAYDITNLRKDKTIHCPYGKVGDKLWVREAWARNTKKFLHVESKDLVFKATDNLNMNWNPSIHMPRWASRVTL